MVSMNYALGTLLVSLPAVTSCVFKADGSLSPPNDAIHQPGSLRGRRLTEKMNEFITNRATHRALLGECFSDDMYDAIHNEIVGIADGVLEIVERAQ